jgi:hypothetical protein
LSSGDWRVIKEETFEGVFPNAGWTLIDANSSDGKEYLWDDDDYRRHRGYWAAWPANGGVDGYDPATNPRYPPNMASWMIYGPFDLSDARAARVSFWLWRQIEVRFDRLFFGISPDCHIFYGWQWDGTADWQEMQFGLDSYLGDSSVWVGWLFESDSTVQYEGPWVDDILIEYMPGQVIVQGQLRYLDRQNNPASGSFVKVYLYEEDPWGQDDLLDTTVTDASGFYQFPARVNWDEDGRTDSIDRDPRLDLYVVWETDVKDSQTARRRVINLDSETYRFYSEKQMNVRSGVVDLSEDVRDDQRVALWIFQDLRRAWEYVINTSGLDPGSVTAFWQKDQNTLLPCVDNSCFLALPVPSIFIADKDAISKDTVVHETGHHYMWNKTGWWLAWDIGCWKHGVFSQESLECAWSEGWADFLPLVVNRDQCFDLGIGPCTGIPDRDHYNLEAHSRNDDQRVFPGGDEVEGRVAGGLYDLFDAQNEGYDSATFGFAPIVSIVFQGLRETTFRDFWESWKASSQDKHHPVRALFQNTIDYNTPPRFEPPLPDRTLLQGFSWRHAIDLWNYAVDAESTDAELDFQIAAVSDPRCQVSLEEDRWVNLAAVAGWLGSCRVTIRVSDSLKTAEDDFQMNVVPVRARVFLPLALKNWP